MLRKMGLTGHTFLFLDDGWLFDHIEKINAKLKAYKENVYVDELFSNPKEIIILLKFDYFHELTPNMLNPKSKSLKSTTRVLWIELKMKIIFCKN